MKLMTSALFDLLRYAPERRGASCLGVPAHGTGRD